ncbi:MAG: carbon starvation protein A, partial [Holophagae bacterium]|nr:carbon starvation protein A [Holophagae bacterium]
MNSVFLIVGTVIAYLLAYRLYGRYLGQKIFKLDNTRSTPAHTMRDNVDYLPTKKEILFGHHFTSIAGLGPIVGPIIAVIWGWLPAMLWVVFGSILIGGIHDMGSIVVSMRNRGLSIGEIASNLINKRSRILFLLIIFFELWIIIAVFALIIAILFTMYPASVLPVWLQIPIAMTVGWYVYRRGGNIYVASLIAIVLMYLTILWGTYVPLSIPSVMGFSTTEIWMIILFIYAFVASILPVWLLLQARDFINALQLVIILVLLTAGVLVAQPM